MGLFDRLKEAKAVATDVMQRAQEAARQPQRQPQPRQQPHGMVAGFAGAMVKLMGPMLMVQAPERGDPLPASDPGVLGPQDTGATQAAAAAIRARDAAFDTEALTTFADQVFAAYCSVWGTGEVSPIRALLADDLWNPLAAAMGTGMTAGVGMIYGNQKGQATLAGLWADEAYDSARFSFAVSVDVPPGQAVPPEILATSWTEDWLLQRSVTPGGEPMASPEHCPSCGAPTSTDASGRCTHCSRPVPALTSGWLVTCVRSHNPTVLAYRDQMVEQLRQNPSELAMLSDELVKLLPRDAVAQIDPQRAATLGFRAAT